MELWTAFITGLVGSLHCVGMCGPIALALPGGFSSRLTWTGGRLLYNLGRTFTYGVLGLGVGFLGKGLALAGIQQSLSIGLGVLLFAGVLVSIMHSRQALQIPFLEKPLARLKGAMGAWLQRHGYVSNLSIGLLNGLLPCGLVYLALAGALSTGSALGGATYMLWFGLGTLPMMLATSMLGQVVKPSWRVQFRHILYGFAMVFAVLLILRGLNLGIPYISPELISGGEAVCH